MTDADHLVLAALEHLAQEARTLERQRLQRQVSLAEIRRHAAEGEAEALRQLVLQRDAFGDRPFDEDTDHALAAGACNQPMRLGALDVETARDLRLGQAGGEIQPGCARRQRRITIDQGQSVGQRGHVR